MPRTRKSKNSAPAAIRQTSDAPDTSCLDHGLGYSLRRAQLSTYPAFNNFMKEFLIRPSQLAVLLLVRHNPGLTQAAVSRVLDITKTNLVPLLDGLEKRGLLERRKAKGDRRAFALHLTRKGETYATKMEVHHNKMEALLRKRLGEKTSDQLLSLLHVFSQSVES